MGKMDKINSMHDLGNSDMHFQLTHPADESVSPRSLNRNFLFNELAASTMTSKVGGD